MLPFAKQPIRCYVPEGATYTPSNLFDVMCQRALHTHQATYSMLCARGRYIHTKQPSRCYVQLLRVFSTIIDINRPDGATYSQTLYVMKYSPRARGFCYCWNHCKHLVHHKDLLRTLVIRGISNKIKALRFIRGVVD